MRLPELRTYKQRRASQGLVGVGVLGGRIFLTSFSFLFSLLSFVFPLYFLSFSSLLYLVSSMFSLFSSLFLSSLFIFSIYFLSFSSFFLFSLSLLSFSSLFPFFSISLFLSPLLQHQTRQPRTRQRQGQENRKRRTGTTTATMKTTTVNRFRRPIPTKGGLVSHGFKRSSRCCSQNPIPTEAIHTGTP